MSDKVGFKISLPGYNVETATPEQCSVDSAYDSFKIKLDPDNPQFGNIVVTFTDNPGVGTYPIYTIHYGYDYIPAYYLFFDVQDSSQVLTEETGNFFALDELDGSYFQAILDTDTQDINISFVVTAGASVDVTNNFFAFRFYVFANDGI